MNKIIGLPIVNKMKNLHPYVTCLLEKKNKMERNIKCFDLLKQELIVFIVQGVFFGTLYLQTLILNY